MGRRLSAVVVVLAVPVTLVAQSPVDADGRARFGMQATLAEQPVLSGVISGIIISDSGAPIARARVALSSAAVRTAVTDERGAFVFASLPPDQYTLSASRIGYLDVVYGQRQPGSGRPGTPIRLEPGQRIDALSLRMPRGGVITGTVLDERGEPAIAVPVRAYRWRLRGGEPAFAAASFDHTDDRGIYRIPFLAPGDYIVAATPRPEFDALELGDNRSSQTPESYAPVFYPGTPQAADASLVRVGISEERSTVDIRLQHVTTGRLSGIVIGTSGGPQSGARVTLGASAQWVSGAGTRATRTGATGQFTFTDVPPGLHVLTVRTDGDATLWGRAEVALDGRDVGGVQIALQRGMTVTGNVTFDGGAPDSGAAGIRLSLTGVGSFGESVAATVQRNGTFAMRNIPPGLYQLTGASLPPGCSLATAAFGGRDALDTLLDVTTDLTGVVTISSRPTEITGSILGDDNRPVFDVTVLAFSAEERFWTPRSRRIQTTRPATDGRFVIRGLPAGEYRVIALPDLDPGQESESAFLQRMAAHSDRVSLSDGERRVHNLTPKPR